MANAAPPGKVPGHPDQPQEKLQDENRIQSPRTHTEVMDSGKNLGVNISEASKTLGFLRRNLSECMKEVKRIAVTAIVRPIMEYASLAWDSSSSEDVTKLEKSNDKQHILSTTITVIGHQVVFPRWFQISAGNHNNTEEE